MAAMSEEDTLKDLLGDGANAALERFDHDRPIDQHDKAADAIDFEDISDDDDLPDEEEGITQMETDHGDVYNGLPSDFRGSFGAPNANGNHFGPDPSSDDLFGNGESSLGDGTPSPKQQRHQRPGPPMSRPTGLALPSMSGLALPTAAHNGTRPQQRHSQYSPMSTSPPSFREEDYADRSPSARLESEEEAEDNTNPEAVQRRLFRTAKRKQAGAGIAEEKQPISMADFYKFFPEYEFDQNPKFLELFPQRPAQYRGKVSIKPPKAVLPTKLSLDLLPDQERSFRSAAGTKPAHDSIQAAGMIRVQYDRATQDDSDSDLALSPIDENETVGGVNMADLAIICEDWGMNSIHAASVAKVHLHDDFMNGGWEYEDRARPSKRRKTDVLDQDLSYASSRSYPSFEDPEREVAKLARHVTLDLNDTHLMIDEHPPATRRAHRMTGDAKHDANTVKDLTRRYNISNDSAYDLLKENHQHKIRSTLGSMAIEHTLPAIKLQYPYYKITLEPKVKRTFHRPSLDLRDSRREYKFQRPLKSLKKKNLRGKDVKELFDTSDKLSLNDNASVLLLEYSEEAPLMMSNFGMGSRLINYYRKRNTDDQERPKRDIGETHVLLMQDKSPFANFGHVDQGEFVPTLQNGLYRAPVFQHTSKAADFLVAVSSTYEGGSRLYLRNVEHLHAVGQQLPFKEVPTEHSRKVTDAAKRRLRALSYRIFTKSQDPTRRDKQLDNATLMPHLPGHDMPQTRSKMREFMKYERMPNREGGVWVPFPGQHVPDSDELHSWIKPEDICLLDAMQVGVQHLDDLGLKDTKGQDEKDEIRDADDKDNIEIKLAPWRTTKNFIGATQGKAMLQLHGEGDPTGRGEGFSFVRTSMKGGFTAPGKSIEDTLDDRKRRDNGGHSYNVAKQQRQYDDYIRMIWDKQKRSLASEMEISDTEMDDDFDAEPESAFPFGRAATPRSSIGTPAAFARRDDDTATQHSRGSAPRDSDKLLVIERDGGRDPTYGIPTPGRRKEVITDPKIIKEYKKRRKERLRANMEFVPFTCSALPSVFTDISPSLTKLDMTGNVEIDTIKREHLEEELARIQRNVERREARERQKGRTTGASPSAAGSPGAASEGDENSSAVLGSADGTPQKGRGRNKEGTARKCANCGQVGHIKTNRKSVYTFSCVFCSEEETVYPDGTVKGSGSGQHNAEGAESASSSFMRSVYSAFKL